MSRILVDFFYAPAVGHAIEALHHCLAVAQADPARTVCLAMNAAAPTELARCWPFVDRAYAVDAPMIEADPRATRSLAHVPRIWDRVLSDPRRAQANQLELFAGMRDHYAAADRWFTAREGRGLLGSEPPSRRSHTRLRLDLPRTARTRAAAVGGTVAFMPAGSGDPSGYPSVPSWTRVLDTVAQARPDVSVVLVGRRPRGDGRTSTSAAAADLARLRSHPAVVADVLDRPLLDQLAVVERCRVFLSPHTGFGMAALSVGTPWLALSGGRWFEWYVNHVPFRSVLPDTSTYPAFSQFESPVTVPDGPDGQRVPSMTRARIEEDLPRLVDALEDLLDARVPYEQCLTDYARDLAAAHGGRTETLWSWDGVLEQHWP